MRELLLEGVFALVERRHCPSPWCWLELPEKLAPCI
jgi:hypothetical protein